MSQVSSHNHQTCGVAGSRMLSEYDHRAFAVFGISKDTVADTSTTSNRLLG